MRMWVLACVALLGCGGAAFDGAVYRGEGFAFRVPPRPPSWELLEVTGAALAYRDRRADATVAVNGRCGVDGEDVPLSALTQHLFLQFTDRNVLLQEVVPFDGREAMHSEIAAKLDGVPKRFDVWVLKKDGCVYDLYMIARADHHAEAVADFHRFVRGFATVAIE